MPDKALTEAEIDAAYAQIAAEQKREAEERQALDAAVRKNSRRLFRKNAGLDEDGNPIPGMWNVILSTGEPYEHSYERGVGLFRTLVAAEKYCDAFDAASNAASRKTVNQYETTFCRIQFVPFGDPEPAFHVLYTVETERDEENLDRRIVNTVRSEIISEKELLKMVESGRDPRLAALWEDRSLAVLCDNENGVSAQKIISSEVFNPVEVFNGVDEDGTPYSYNECYETFLTFDPDNVVLEKR